MAQGLSESPTLRLHRRQRLWQILLPVLLLVVLMLAVAVLSVFAETGETRLWSDVAIILLITPMLMLALVLLVVLVVLIYSLGRLGRAAPNVTARMQATAGRLNSGVQRVAKGVVKPFGWLEEFSSAVKALVGILLRR